MTDERRTKAGLAERAHHAGEDKPAMRYAVNMRGLGLNIRRCAALGT